MAAPDILTGALPDVFRDVMAEVCTPVAVVTTVAGDRPRGTTVSAFASLSLSPPMVLVSLDQGSDLLGALRGGVRFGVNVLGSGQAVLAAAFARKGGDKFAGVDWELDAGAPRLSGSPGWLACRVDRLVGGGDHVIVLGEVLRAVSDGGPPLTYHARRFGTHQAMSA
jgi:flavin reductase (DIM6/NTAB) family NADH-FMN oxidoreductase RutF